MSYNPPSAVPYGGYDRRNQHHLSPQNFYGNQVPLQQLQHQQYRPPLQVPPTKSTHSAVTLTPGPASFGPPHDPPPYSFEQKFVVQRPKYNDLWAAILASAPMFAEYWTPNKGTCLGMRCNAHNKHIVLVRENLC